MKEKTTKVKAKKSGKRGMRAEYDFSGGVRGKYFERVSQSSNIVALDPDVAAKFADSDAVNEALRALLRVTEATDRLITSRTTRRTKKRAA